MTRTQCSPESVLRVILPNSNRGLESIRRLCTNSSIVSGPLPNRPPIGRLGAVGFSVMPCGSDITWVLTCTSFSPHITLPPVPRACLSRNSVLFTHVSASRPPLFLSCSSRFSQPELCPLIRTYFVRLGIRITLQFTDLHFSTISVTAECHSELIRSPLT